MRSTEERFLLSLCELESVILPSEMNWTRFWQLVKLNAVEIQVCTALESMGMSDRIPQHILDFTRSTLEVNQQRVECFSTALDRILQAHIPICLLKGAAFGAILYDNLLYKRMNDVDLLIKKEDFANVVTILEECGFSTFSNQNAHGNHHTLPFFHPPSKTALGIHWNLVSEKKNSIPVDMLWENMQGCCYNGRQVQTLSNEMHLLHLCIHLPFLKTGLRELVDVCMLIKRKEIFWEQFFQFARSISAYEQVFRVLTFAKSLIPYEMIPAIPEDFSDHCRSFVRKETLARLRHLLQSRSTIVTEIERWFLLYQLSPNIEERRLAFHKIWSRLLGYSPTLYAGFSIPPFGLMRVLAIEHGWKKVCFSLAGLTIHRLIQGALIQWKKVPGMLDNSEYQLFFEME